MNVLTNLLQMVKVKFNDKRFNFRYSELGQDKFEEEI